MRKIIICVIGILFAVITNVAIGISETNPADLGDQFKSSDQLPSPPMSCADFKSNNCGTTKSSTKSVTVIEGIGKKPAIGHPYLGIMAGIGLPNKMGEQQLDTTAGIDQGYTQYSPTDNYDAAVYGINGGYEFMLPKNVLLSLGVGIYQNSNYRAKGQVWSIYAPNTSDNTYEYNYEYKLQNTRFMLETQFAWQLDLKKIKLIPFISLGVGPALNLANSYEETPVDPTVQVIPWFKSNRNISFAYQLGAGIACPFNANRDRFFVAYKYVDLGTVRFNTRPITIVGATTYQLDIRKIRSNEIYIGYTHLFDS